MEESSIIALNRSGKSVIIPSTPAEIIDRIAAALLTVPGNDPEINLVSLIESSLGHQR